MFLKLLLHGIFLIASNAHEPQSITPIYICTATDNHYFRHLLNFIGSVHKINFDELGEIAVFDLGMSQENLDKLKLIEKVTVHAIRKTHPDILKPFQTTSWGKFVPGWYAWKPVAIKQALETFEYVLWMDAGMTVLKPLNDVAAYVKEHGYFLAKMGCEREGDGSIIYRGKNGWQSTQYIKTKFNLESAENKSILEKESIAACFMGFARNEKSHLLDDVYVLTFDLRNFQDDGTCQDGFGCGRHDQAIFSNLAYLKEMKLFDTDYMQHTPMVLDVAGKQKEFYLTWHGYYVNDKTCIYHSRSDTSRLEYYSSFIKYKK